MNSSLRYSLLLLATISSLTFALESSKAEDGYETFPSLYGSRYKLYTIQLTWPQAYSICQNDGGGAYLVVINSKQEADIVKEMFSRIDESVAPFLFVGINDLVQKGIWVTIQGGLVSASGFNSWSPGEPDGFDGQQCGIMLRDGLYGSHECNNHRSFICEKPDV